VSVRGIRYDMREVVAVLMTL